MADAMDAAVATFGACEAYVDGPRRVTFAEWIAAADGVALGGRIGGHAHASARAGTVLR